MTTGVSDRDPTRTYDYRTALRLEGGPAADASTGSAAQTGATTEPAASPARRSSPQDVANARLRFDFESNGSQLAYQLQSRFRPIPDNDEPVGGPDDGGGTGTLEEAGGTATLGERAIDFGEVPQVEHTARPAQGVGSEAEEWNAVTGYITGEMTTNMNSSTTGKIRDANEIWLGAGKPAAYALWAERVGPGRPWDHKGAIQNAYGLSTPVPGKEGEISWDVWSNIHYGVVGAHAKFSGKELQGGANVADLASGHGTNAGDQLAVKIGIELYEKYGTNVTQAQVQQAVIDHYDEFGAAGKIYGDPKYLPEGWKSPYSKDG